MCVYYACFQVINQNDERRESGVNRGEKQKCDTGNRNAEAGTDMGRERQGAGMGKSSGEGNSPEPSVLTNIYVDVVMAFIPLYVN